MKKDLITFITRGRAVDLAIAVVVGASFGAVVTAFVVDILTPLIGAVAGEPDFSTLKFTINNSVFLYGDFINAVVSFLIIASVIFFFVVQPINKLSMKNQETLTTNCPECLGKIPKKAKRCQHCSIKITNQ